MKRMERAERAEHAENKKLVNEKIPEIIGEYSGDVKLTLHENT